MTLKSKLSTLALVTPLLLGASAWAQDSSSETAVFSEPAVASSPVLVAAPSMRAVSQVSEASQRWSALATKIVQGALATTGQYPRIYVAPPAKATLFESSLHQYLLVHLAKSGAIVQTQPGQGVSTLTVTSSVLPVYTSDVSLVHRIADTGRHWAGLPAVVRAEGVTVETAEVEVASSLSDSGVYLFNQTEVFPVLRDELAHYRTPPRTLVIVGDK